MCLLISCARLPAGPYTASSPPNVILIRGYQDWYSTGIDKLAAELRSDGQNAQSYREEQWGDLADWLESRPRRPLVLIGFSYGADDVILISRRLNDRHLVVDLLITIDPVTPVAISANVKKCVNFYQPNGFWDLFPFLRGMPATGAQNINVRARPDLIEPDTSHATIAGNEKIHTAIRGMIRNESAR